MGIQIMGVKSQEMVVTAYSMMRSDNQVYGALQAVKANGLVNALRNGVVHGYFIKKDGKVREFWGTTNRTLASKKTVHELGFAPRLSYGVIPFIDCETGRWRSLRIGSLISFDA